MEEMIKYGVISRDIDINNWHSLQTYSKQKYFEICAKSGILFGVIQ